MREVCEPRQNGCDIARGTVGTAFDSALHFHHLRHRQVLTAAPPLIVTCKKQPYGQELFPIPVPPLPGLLVKAFRGEASILEVECTGDMLSADVDVFQMTLYTTADNEVVAYVNPLKNECLTSRSFLLLRHRRERLAEDEAEVPRH
ncbi:hypothetical protein C0Q70_12248 [Pomacea canaliculata]|uniref:Uncharacterized protein n=1 Tax=Pomacea canaliculata TaxID=400727 RepID=A0A2T7P0Z9_POMCA|nr:hypothetical protein C0Q70_12248 [Pomacea canaliculata]